MLNPETLIVSTPQSSTVAFNVYIPVPPDVELRVREAVIWPYGCGDPDEGVIESQPLRLPYKPNVVSLRYRNDNVSKS